MKAPPDEWLANHAELHQKQNRAAVRLSRAVLALCACVLVLSAVTFFEGGHTLGWW